MFIAPADGPNPFLPLSLNIVDVSREHSSRQAAARSSITSRARRRVSGTVANLVRLVPGRTHLPLGAGER
jgi:hypothetical protein